MGNFMSAAFMVEGCLLSTTAAAMPGASSMGPVEVVLRTDGVFVWLEDGSRLRPPLTAQGWEELAGHAADLVDEANRAWNSMQAVR